MTDREWPENSSGLGEETVTGPETAQEEAASVGEDGREISSSSGSPMVVPPETAYQLPYAEGPSEPQDAPWEEPAAADSQPGEEPSFVEARGEEAPAGEMGKEAPSADWQPSSQASSPEPELSQQGVQTPPPPSPDPGQQAPYQQAPQQPGYGRNQHPGGWYSQQRQSPPNYCGRPPYQAPNPYRGQTPYGYPPQPGYYQGQPGGYQGYRPQPPVPAAEPVVPPQPPVTQPPEDQNPEPPEKKKMNKKTKVFLWVIGVVLVLLGAAMVLYSVGLASGWFGQGAGEPPQTSSSAPAPQDDQKLLEIEEIPQDGMMTPNQVYEKVKHSVVAVVTYGQGSDLTDSPISSGSGIVFSEDGYIVTNSHVVGDSNQYPVKVVFTGRDENEEDKEYPAQIVGYDKRTDIAVLKINATGLTPAEFADSDQLKVGDTVLSLGNPGVAGENFTNTLTKGMVSAVNRTVTMSSINMQYIQTDAAINPGSSGGALLNLYGQVVGINAAKITTTEIEGICFAIPTNIAKDVINDIVKNGYVSDRVRLGITIRSLSSYEAQMYNVPQGLVIVGFSDDSELPGKGAEIGDIITAINGVETTTSNTLYSQLEKFKAGDKVKLTIYRQASGDQKARTFEIEVTLLQDKGETQSAVSSEAP